MARRWGRMVRKNSKEVDKFRRKAGKPSIYDGAAAQDGSVTYKGRSWLLAIVLVLIGMFCFVAFRSEAQDSTFYWITGMAYLLLAALIYWVRRPFLKIGRKTLASRRFGGDRFMDADQIAGIDVSKDGIVVTFKGKRAQRWAFSRLFHLFPVDEMVEPIKAFAERNGVPFQQYDSNSKKWGEVK